MSDLHIHAYEKEPCSSKPMHILEAVSGHQ